MGVSTTLGRGRGTGPDGLAVIADTCMAADAAAAGVQALSAEERGFAQAVRYLKGVPACAAACSSWASGSAWPAPWRSPDEPGVQALEGGTGTRRSRAAGRGAPRAEVNHHLYRYHVLDDPEVSDAEYDELIGKLRSLEGSVPAADRPDSPTQRVGAPAAELFRPVRTARRCSPSTTRSPRRSCARGARASAWAERRRAFVCELKIDGVACALTYEDGVLTAATRGDGRTGEDITANVRTLQGVPRRLDVKDRPKVIEVRGEVYFPVKAFEG